MRPPPTEAIGLFADQPITPGFVLVGELPEATYFRPSDGLVEGSGVIVGGRPLVGGRTKGLYFLSPGETPRLLVEIGSGLPGGATVTILDPVFGSTGRLVVNGNGQAAFRALVETGSDSGYGVYLIDDPVLPPILLLAQNGFDSEVPSAQFIAPSLAINDAGDVAMIANRVLTEGGSALPGIFLSQSDDRTTLATIVARNDPAPGTEGDFSTFGTGGSDDPDLVMNGVGDLAFVASTTDGGRGIWKWVDGEVKLIALSGATAPDSDIVFLIPDLVSTTSNIYLTINSNGQVAFSKGVIKSAG